MWSAACHRPDTFLGSDAPPLLLKAASQLESLHLELARETYLDAWWAALFAGSLAGAGDLQEVSRAARALPRPAYPPGLVDLLLDGLALLVTDGPAAAAATLRQAAGALAHPDISSEEGLRWGWMAQGAAYALWDYDGWRAVLCGRSSWPVTRARSTSCRSTWVPRRTGQARAAGHR